MTQTQESDESRGGKGERKVGICHSAITRKLVPSEKDFTNLFKRKLYEVSSRDVTPRAIVLFNITQLGAENLATNVSLSDDSYIHKMNSK